MISLGSVPASTTIYVPFSTYAGSTGASVTCTGLAVTDIEIYKNGSVTQRSSDAGYTLLDTDGIDFDGITGLHGFSIDLSDNTDAGFYAVGSWYWVVVSAITVDSQTVTFLAAVFRIAPAEGIAGYPKTDIHALKGDATSATDLQDFADAGYDPATNKVQGVVLVDTLTTYTGNTVQTGDSFAQIGVAGAGLTNIDLPNQAFDLVGNITGNLIGSVGSVTAAITLPTIPTAWITADGIAADAIGASELAASAITEMQSGLSTLGAADIRTAVGLASANLDTQIGTLATAANLATVAGYLDTEIAAILADTNELQTDWANGGRLDLILDATATQTSVNTIDDFLDTEIAAIQTAVVTTIPASIATVDTWVKRNAVILSGLISTAGTATEVFTISSIGVTATVTVDASGNRSNVVWS